MLINCVAYEAGRKLAGLSPDRPEDLAPGPERPDRFLCWRVRRAGRV